MTNEQFADLVQLKHEVSGVEFKPPGLLHADKSLFYQVARAVLGMANRRDGGSIVIGIREDSGKFELVGLTSAELESWRYDLIADGLGPIAEPAVVFETAVHEYVGRRFVLIEVEEFEDIPIICRRNFPRSLKPGHKAILRDGAVYVRPRRKPETTEVAGQTEMRDLLELAIEKRLRQMLGTVSRAGATLQSRPSVQQLFVDELPEDLR